MARYLSHRITAVFMALLMFLTSTGFSMDMHFCQDRLVSISLLGKAESCHKLKKSACHTTKKSCHSQKSCHHSKAGTNQKDLFHLSDKDSCCHNETVVVKKSDIEATAPQLAADQDIQLDVVAAFVMAYLFNYDPQTFHKPHTLYKPPLPDRDIQVLYQTFLI